MKGTNIIRKGVIIIESNKTLLHPLNLQSEASYWCNDELIPFLEKSLEKYSCIEDVIDFDEIEVSLSLKEVTFTKEAVEKILHQVEGVIQQKIDIKARQDSFSQGVEQNNIALGKRNVSDALVFFLRFGYLPWWSSIKTVAGFYEEVERLSAQMSIHDRKLLTTLLEDDGIIKRLSTSLPTDIFISLVAAISTKSMEEVKEHLEYGRRRTFREIESSAAPANKVLGSTNFPTQTSNPFQLFVSYLKYGYFPGNGYINSIAALHEIVLPIVDSLSETERKELKELLSGTVILNRFTSGLPEETASAIISSISKRPVEEANNFASGIKSLGSIFQSSEQQRLFELLAKQVYIKLRITNDDSLAIEELFNLLTNIQKLYDQFHVHPNSKELEAAVENKMRSVFKSVFSFYSGSTTEEDDLRFKKMIILQLQVLSEAEREFFRHCVNLRRRLAEDERTEFLKQFSRDPGTSIFRPIEVDSNKRVETPMHSESAAKIIRRLNLLAKEQADQKKEGIYISNAGLILLAPFLPRFFENIGLFISGRFVNKDAGLAVLHWLVTGEETYAEFTLVLPKIICGMEPEEPAEILSSLPENYKAEGENLLASVIEHWGILKNTTVDGLRQSFLQREGKLTLNGEEWLLQVEQKPFDMLLGQLPWNINMVKLSWMPVLVRTEWIG